MISLFLTIRDNVLEIDDFPIFRLKINYDGTLLEKKTVKDGVYGASLLQPLETSLSYVQELLDIDTTGSHPEIYYQLLSEAEVNEILLKCKE
jgi:hypothetical protein